VKKLLTAKPSASNNRAFIGAWFIAAMCVLGVNLEKLGEVHSPPEAANSPLVNALRFKLHLCEQLLYERKTSSGEPWQKPIVAASLPQPAEAPQRRPEEAPAEPGREPGTDLTFQMPRLSGILMVASGSAGSRYAAVLDGRVFSAKETCNGFKIEEIGLNGVRLSQNKRSWFVPAPEVLYSIERPK
jgi:hypothetical protein